MANERVMTECRFCDKESRLDKHFHNAYELMLLRKGCAKVTISEIEYIVKENTLVFISNFEEHNTQILEYPCERYFANFNTTRFDKQIGDAKLMSVFKNRPVGFAHCFPLDEATGERIEKMFRRIMDENENQQPFHDEAICAIVKQILIIAYRKMGDSFPLPLKNVKNEIFEVQRYIEQHFAEDIQISEIADRLYINSFYLSHCFKELTGYSPKQYLLLNRLAMAKELLISTNMPVNEVSFKSGFSDINNFIRYFKKEVGTTPNKYRVTF